MMVEFEYRTQTSHMQAHNASPKMDLSLHCDQLMFWAMSLK